MTYNSCSEGNEIEWNNVFVLNEFVKNFDIKSLAEFSLVSKFNRNRLKPTLFSYSALVGKNYFNYFMNSISEYEGIRYFNLYEYFDNFIELDRYYIDLKEQLSNVSKLLDLKDKLIQESKKIEPLIKSLRIFELGHLFYVLYPTTFVFTNLTQLEIDSCTFPLLALLKIGESLKKLKILTLKSVLAIEFKKQQLSSSLTCIPSTLEELNLDFFYIVTLNPNSTEFYIAQNQNFNDCIESIYSEQLIPSSLKRVTLILIKPDYILLLLNLKLNVEEITITDYSLDQKIIDKFSIMKNLKKLSIRTYDPESPTITNQNGFIFPQFNFITDLSLDFSECMYKSNNEFLYFTNHFPNLTRLSIDLTDLNFANIDIGNFFLETLPSYKKLEILTLVYMEFEEKYNFDWFSSINVECLILDFNFVYPDEINFNLFSYKIKQIRKRMQLIKLELMCIEDNPELFDKWTITNDEKYIYFNRQIKF